MSLERRAFLAGLLASAFAPAIPVAPKTAWYLTPRDGTMLINRKYGMTSWTITGFDQFGEMVTETLHGNDLSLTRYRKITRILINDHVTESMV